MCGPEEGHVMVVRVRVCVGGCGGVVCVHGWVAYVCTCVDG